MNATVTEKWTAVFADEALAKKVLEMSAEDAQKELAANGYEFTLEEMYEAGEEINKAMQSVGNGELTEDNLEDVAGGSTSLANGLRQVGRVELLPGLRIIVGPGGNPWRKFKWWNG